MLVQRCEVYLLVPEIGRSKYASEICHAHRPGRRGVGNFGMDRDDQPGIMLALNIVRFAMTSTRKTSILDGPKNSSNMIEI